METKAKPNPNGCLAKALPTEPFLVLLARDASAPRAIRFWCEDRAKAGVEGDRSQDAEQLIEAFETADAMERWRADHEGEWRDPDHARTLNEGLAQSMAEAWMHDRGDAPYLGIARSAVRFMLGLPSEGDFRG